MVDENYSGYLTDNIDLEQGSVDDQGDAAYVRLSQNVPNGYVENRVKWNVAGQCGLSGTASKLEYTQQSGNLIKLRKARKNAERALPPNFP